MPNYGNWMQLSATDFILQCFDSSIFERHSKEFETTDFLMILQTLNMCDSRWTLHFIPSFHIMIAFGQLGSTTVLMLFKISSARVFNSREPVLESRFWYWEIALKHNLQAIYNIDTVFELHSVSTVLRHRTPMIPPAFAWETRKTWKNNCHLSVVCVQTPRT